MSESGDTDKRDDDGEKTVIQTPQHAKAADADDPTAPLADNGDDGKTVIQPSPTPKDQGALDDDDQRTVIAPETPSGENDDDRTIIAPATNQQDAPSDAAEQTLIAASPEEPKAPAAPPSPKPLAKPISGITNGQVLNHTYEVKRFIARGGMGEVFEGVNVTNGQRVAIKVILPALASDPAVIEMFVKEATVLERLVHPALVNYRTQARDPEAGVFYIVTNYIEGTSLESVIGTITPSVEDIVGLARRLAEGLGVAHGLGAIHRDIAPDNILLEDDDLAKAQIIDFGIARDIDPGSKTVIGTGFAGKYSFVAPEQLGAFKSDVGAWSDIYSLGLVLLGLARGKTLKLGSSPVEANDLRKEGIDTSEAPQALRPLLDAMLVYDPAQRLRSMDDVLAALDSIDLSEAGGDYQEHYAPDPTDQTGDDNANGIGFAKQNQFAVASLPKPALLAGGGVLGIAVIGGLGMIAFGGSDDVPVSGASGASGNIVVEAIDATTAMQRAENALENVSCHWIEFTLDGQEGAFRLGASGVAAQPGVVEPAVFGALEGGGVSTDFSAVAPIPEQNCAVIDILRPYRAVGETAITQPQQRSEIERFPANYEIPSLSGKTGARHAVDINLPGDTPIAALAFAQGEVAVLGADTVLNLLGPDAREAAGQFRVDTTSEAEEPGWTSVIVMQGDGQLDAAANALSSREFDTFRQLADANNIKVNMVWHQLVDDVPN